jgi:hypothetical protein
MGNNPHLLLITGAACVRATCVLRPGAYHVGCLLLQISFDDLPRQVGQSPQQRRDFWERSRRLQHGTLVTLWSEPADALTPHLIVAVIAKRDLDQLAPKNPDIRPSIGIRWVSLCRGN